MVNNPTNSLGSSYGVMIRPPWAMIRADFTIAPQESVLNPGLDIAALKGFCLGVIIHSITADPRSSGAIIQSPASFAAHFDSEKTWTTWRRGGWYGGTFKEFWLRNPYKDAGLSIALSYIVGDQPWTLPPVVGFMPTPIDTADLLNLKMLGVGETFEVAETAVGPPNLYIWNLSRSAPVIPSFEGGMTIRQAMDRGRPAKVLPVSAFIDLWLYNKTLNAVYPPGADMRNFHAIVEYNVQDQGYREAGGNWASTTAASSAVIDAPFDLASYVGVEKLHTSGLYAAHYRLNIPRIGIIAALSIGVPALTNFTHWQAAIHSVFEQVFTDPQEYNRQIADGPWSQY